MRTKTNTKAKTEPVTTRRTARHTLATKSRSEHPPARKRGKAEKTGKPGKVEGWGLMMANGFTHMPWCYVRPEFKEAVRVAARERGVSMAALQRWALAEWMNDYAKECKDGTVTYDLDGVPENENR